MTYIIELVPFLGLSYNTILDMSIVEIFNLTTYKMDYNLNKEQQLEAWRKSH